MFKNLFNPAILIFSEEWFRTNQKLFLWFANTWIGRKILCIDGEKSSVGKRKIIKIESHAITWKKSKYSKFYQTEFRTHNKFGKRLFYAFYPIWYLVHLWDLIIANNFQPAWNLGFDTLTVYPDANAETDTVDGNASMTYGAGSGVSWATLKADAGSTAQPSVTQDNAVALFADVAVSNKWKELDRGIYLFKTSGLGVDATISAGVFSIKGYYKGDSASLAPSINVYSSAPATDTNLVAGDYDSLGTTPFSTTVTYAGYIADNFNDFTLNAAGLAAISKTGNTKFGTRDPIYDVGSSTPTWANPASAGLGCDFADFAGTTSDPKLVVTYTPAVPRHGFTNFQNPGIV